MFSAYSIFTILYFMLYDKGVARGLIVVVSPQLAVFVGEFFFFCEGDSI